MENIIQLHGEGHREFQLLLPWYVTGRLDAADKREVEAHLAGCPDCQAALAAEKILKAEVVGMTVDVEQSWAVLHAQLASQAQSRRPVARAAAHLRAWFKDRARDWTSSEPWLRWAVAGQACALVALSVVALPSILSKAPVEYHALGAAPGVQTANLAVMFRPDMPEGRFRSTLKGLDARIVDGPTTADVYLLQVPAATRAAALARLHKMPETLMAEPIDAGSPQ
jgi:hypothetical protein